MQINLNTYLLKRCIGKRYERLRYEDKNSIIRLFPFIIATVIINLNLNSGGKVMNFKKVGEQIAALRKAKGLTQSELGERIGVSFQAVSKWERGETLPDITLLPDLAKILETTVDFILIGSEKVVEYKGKFTVTDMKKGLDCIKNAGEYLGKENIIYRAAIKGINTDLNTDIEEAFSNDYIFEAFLAEAIIQNLIYGLYVDISDVKNNFKHEHFKNIVVDYCNRRGIK